MKVMSYKYSFLWYKFILSGINTGFNGLNSDLNRVYTGINNLIDLGDIINGLKQEGNGW